MIISEEDFLEHYGVKGMRWGVRRKRTSSGTSSSSGEGASGKSESKKDYTMLKRTAVLTAGAGVAAYLVAKNGNKKANLASKEIAIDKHLHKAASLRQSLGKNKVPKAPKKAFKQDPDLAKMKAKAASAVKEANAQLRARDNEFNIPFPERSYLKEW